MFFNFVGKGFDWIKSMTSIKLKCLRSIFLVATNALSIIVPWLIIANLGFNDFFKYLKPFFISSIFNFFDKLFEAFLSNLTKTGVFNSWAKFPKKSLRKSSCSFSLVISLFLSFCQISTSFSASLINWSIDSPLIRVKSCLFWIDF